MPPALRRPRLLDLARLSIAALLILLMLALPGGRSVALAAMQLLNAVLQVSASVETEPVPHIGDAADDMAIWIDPIDSSRSMVIGTDKSHGAEGVGGGLLLYDLAGQQLQYLSVGGINNVDLRYNFPLSGKPIDIVVGNNVRYSSIAVYRVDPQTRRLENITVNERYGIATQTALYGLCMYRSPSGKYYVFVTKNPRSGDNIGEIQQWELFDNGSGKVDGKKVRTFYVGSEAEGCVADDVFGNLYVAETEYGIWKYNAEPDGGSTRELVASVDSGQFWKGLEGITLYYTSKHIGYIVVSVQSSDTFVVYRRETNAHGKHDYVTTFRIGNDNGIDGVEDTDGIDVTNAALGSQFNHGLFIAQDGQNDLGNQNFKLVRWDAIAHAANPGLMTNTDWNPREVGAEDWHEPSPPPSSTPTATAIATSTPLPTATSAPTPLSTPTPGPSSTVLPVQSLPYSVLIPLVLSQPSW